MSNESKAGAARLRRLASLTKLGNDSRAGTAATVAYDARQERFGL